MNIGIRTARVPRTITGPKIPEEKVFGLLFDPQPLRAHRKHSLQLENKRVLITGADGLLEAT